MIQIPSIKSRTTFVRKTLPSTKTHFGHFLQILKKGSPQKFWKKFSAKMPDLREKCAYIKIYDIIWSSSFLLFKNVDFEQNSWFFGPKSRKGSLRLFFANFQEGIASKNFKKIFGQNAWFERKMCICQDSWYHMIIIFSSLQKRWF